jgi:guanylate cyclase
MKQLFLFKSKREMMSSTLSSHTLLRLFPFALIFRSDLKIISTGKQLRIMFLDKGINGHSLDELVKMRRPRVNLTWDNVRKDCMIVFIS